MLINHLNEMLENKQTAKKRKESFEGKLPGLTIASERLTNVTESNILLEENQLLN